MPRIFVRLQTRLLESDPGCLRFRQAAKSLLAVAIALVLFSHASTIPRLFAAIYAAFLMQCVDSGGLRRQKISMVATAAAMVIVAPVGSALHGHLAAEAVLLVFWAGAVFYARRFLKGNGGFTLFAFTQLLLATALPGDPKMQVVTASAGFAIAFVVRFYVWPPDEARAFRDAVSTFVAHARGSQLQTLHESVQFAANLLIEHPELDNVLRRRLIQEQYEILQALRMVHENHVHPAIADLGDCRLGQVEMAFRADLATLQETQT